MTTVVKHWIIIITDTFNRSISSPCFIIGTAKLNPRGRKHFYNFFWNFAPKIFMIIHNFSVPRSELNKTNFLETLYISKYCMHIENEWAFTNTNKSRRTIKQYNRINGNNLVPMKFFKTKISNTTQTKNEKQIYQLFTSSICCIVFIFTYKVNLYFFPK